MRYALLGMLTLMVIVLAMADRAGGADLPAELRWRPAPAAVIPADQGLFATGPSLFEMAAAAAKGLSQDPGRSTSEPMASDRSGTGSKPARPAAASQPPPIVVPREAYPLAYRPILRRYFDSLRSDR